MLARKDAAGFLAPLAATLLLIWFLVLLGCTLMAVAIGGKWLVMRT